MSLSLSTDDKDQKDAQLKYLVSALRVAFTNIVCTEKLVSSSSYNTLGDDMYCHEEKWI